MRPKYRSSIPKSAKPRVEGRHPNGAKSFVQYRVRGKFVGRRWFDEDGNLEFEDAQKDGKPHGYEYYFEMGAVTFACPWVNGVEHGTARQWSDDGRLIGTYTMRRGIGIDLWRCQYGDTPPYLSEVWTKKNGRLHGFNWWLNEDQKTVHGECHFQDGAEHGIRRHWNALGRLRRGYPKYFVRGKPVSKRRYLKASEADATLPKFRIQDNKPARKFPPEIAKHLRRD